MDAFDQFKEDVRAGRIDSDRLVQIIVVLQQQWELAQHELQAAQQRSADGRTKGTGYIISVLLWLRKA